MKTILNLIQSLGKFIYALFFTREDDLDTLQVMFAVIIVVALLILWRLSIVQTDTSDTVLVEILKTLRWMIGLLVVTAVPKWLVPFMVNRANSAQQEETKNIEEPWDEPTEYTDNKELCNVHPPTN